MNIKNHIAEHISHSVRTIAQITTELSEPIENAATTSVQAFKNGNKLLIAGNGGSAADAQHLAAEFIIRLNKDIVRPALPAIALTTDSSILTASGNDIGFENLFKRQIEGLGATGDVFLAISTSGNSVNLIKAIEMAKSRKMTCIGLLGNTGGEMAQLLDASIIVPADNTQHIQEAHLCIYHLICDLVERLYIL